jgi:hypothetical protein
MLLALAAAVAATSATAPCSGYYAHASRSGGFSIKVEPTVVEIVWIDYSPTSLMRYRRHPDGSITFNIDGEQSSVLRCNKDGATFVRGASEYSAKRAYRLTHAPGDIFAVARSRGWRIGD